MCLLSVQQAFFAINQPTRSAAIPRTTTMALLAAAISAGAVAGGGFSGWLPRIQRQGVAVVVAILVWGAAMVGFGVASGLASGTAGLMLWIALLFLAIGGAADMVSSAFRNTILQGGGIR